LSARDSNQIENHSLEIPDKGYAAVGEYPLPIADFQPDGFSFCFRYLRIGVFAGEVTDLSDIL
jgi:hypothetical protein